MVSFGVENREKVGEKGKFVKTVTSPLKKKMFPFLVF